MTQRTSNKSNGNRFEQELAERLSSYGVWVHVLQQNKAGQPADLIVCKGLYATLIDCKVISNDRGFPLRRVEENQRYAMHRFTETTGRMCWFAMKLPDESVHFLSSMAVFTLFYGSEKSISEADIRRYSIPLQKWIDNFKTC